jgi:hypothetical protein
MSFMKSFAIVAALTFGATAAYAQDSSAPAAPAADVAAPAEAAAPAAETPAPVEVAAPAPAIVAAPAAAPVPQCELHIWPAERFQAMTTGWLSGFGVAGAIADSAGHADGDKARRSHLASALDSEGQLKSLQELNLISLLGLKPSQIITHEEPLNRKTVNKIKTRRAQSSSPCYSELIVADVFYHKAAIYGRSLKTLFMFRDFGSAQEDPSIHKSWGGNGLKLFPPKEGEDVSAADAELVSVFKRNFEEAAGNFSRQRVSAK